MVVNIALGIVLGVFFLAVIVAVVIAIGAVVFGIFKRHRIETKKMYDEFWDDSGDAWEDE